MANELEKLMGKKDEAGQGGPKRKFIDPAIDSPKKDALAEATEQITVRLPVSLASELREVADLLGGPPFKLTIKRIVRQGVEKELQRLRPDAQRMREFAEGLNGSPDKQAVNT